MFVLKTKRTRKMQGVNTMLSDPDREIRAMILSSHPCPPLPQLVLRDSTGETGEASSHDLIACAMTASKNYATFKSEQYRLELNQQHLHAYNAILDRLYEDYLAATTDAAKQGVIDLAYQAMQTFTRQTVAAYMAPLLIGGTTKQKPDTDIPVPDIRFRDMSEVCVGDKVHNRLVDYIVANRIVVGHDLQQESQIKHMSFRDLIERIFVLYCEDGKREAVQEVD